jgi:hypothetical protein
MSLDDLEQRLIRAAQRDLAPSPADRERNQTALLGRLDGAGPWGGAAVSGLGLHGGNVGSAGAVGRALASLRESRLSMLGVGLVVGAVVGGWLGFGLGRGSTNPVEAGPKAVASAPAHQTASPDPGLPVGDPSDSSLALDFAADASAPAPPLDLSAAAPMVPSGLDGRNVPRARASAGRRAAATSKPESSLARELAMLQRARRALNADNGRLALGIVQELDERFPQGVLIEERSATKVLSLCQLERVGEAKEAARAFLERYPASVYAERVRKGCAAASGQ